MGDEGLASGLLVLLFVVFAVLVGGMISGKSRGVPLEGRVAGGQGQEEYCDGVVEESAVVEEENYGEGAGEAEETLWGWELALNFLQPR